MKEGRKAEGERRMASHHLVITVVFDGRRKGNRRKGREGRRKRAEGRKKEGREGGTKGRSERVKENEEEMDEGMKSREK